jgi:hypothetical protein
MSRLNLAARIKRCRNVHDSSSTQSLGELGADDAFCQMCGVTSGDVDDFTGQVVVLRTGRIPRVGVGLSGALLDFDVLCPSCYHGAREIVEERARLLHN